MRKELIGLIVLLILIAYVLSGCASKQVRHVDEYRLGDRVKIIAGEYEGGTAVIQVKVAQEITRKGCSKEYSAFIMRKGFWLDSYVCHEELDGEIMQ